jgi:RNA-directed DNA polymerase
LAKQLFKTTELDHSDFICQFFPSLMVSDKWMQKYYLNTPWYRYADYGLAHCQSEMEAQQLLSVLASRFEACGLALHPTKTKIAYCKDGSRKGKYENISFDFLGYNFRPRVCRNRKRNSMFVSFTPAVSKVAFMK